MFRVLLFKLFNKVATWELLVRALGQPTLANFSVDEYDRVLTDAFGRGERITRPHTSCRRQCRESLASTART